MISGVGLKIGKRSVSSDDGQKIHATPLLFCLEATRRDAGATATFSVTFGAVFARLFLILTRFWASAAGLVCSSSLSAFLASLCDLLPSLANCSAFLAVDSAKMASTSIRTVSSRQRHGCHFLPYSGQESRAKLQLDAALSPTLNPE